MTVFDTGFWRQMLLWTMSCRRATSATYRSSLSGRGHYGLVALAFINIPQILVESTSGLIGPMRVGGPISSQSTGF